MLCAAGCDILAQQAGRRSQSANSSGDNPPMSMNPGTPPGVAACEGASDCDDGDPCTRDDVCTAGECRGTPIEGCARCTTPGDCDDANPCTDDVCGTAGVCVHADNVAPCDDADPCTQADTCGGGDCAGTPLPGCVACASAAACDDGDPCTDDICGADGICANTANTAACDDGDPCTSDDTCADGACRGEFVRGCLPCGSAGACDDSNPCTDDDCVAGVCAHAPTSAACDDGNACTTNDACAGGACAGTPIAGCTACQQNSDCSDGNACTSDACTDEGTCAFTAIPGCGGPPQFALTVNTSGPGAVTLNPPGPSYSAGTMVMLTAVPTGCAVFDHWEGALSGAANPQTLTISAATTVVAVFVSAPLVGNWTFQRTVSAVGGNDECNSPQVGTQDAIPVAITSSADGFTITMSFAADDDHDLDGNDLIDQSPGQLWFMSIPIICPQGSPYEVQIPVMLSGSMLSGEVHGPDVGYCQCNFFTDATFSASVDATGCLSGTLSIALQRICAQFAFATCSIDYTFTATRN
jgi:hypothetical protein